MKGLLTVVLIGCGVLVGLSAAALARFGMGRPLAGRAALQRAYDELRRSQPAMVQQERLRALGQMASGIAHDLSNAIAPVTLYAESLLAEEAGLTARGRRNLAAIRHAIQHVSRTVARMREFYRQREPQLALLPVDLNALVREVIELTRARWYDMAQRQGIVIDVRTELAADLPAIAGSESELRDALVNLIFNAIDAMPDGGPLTIRTELTAPPDRYVRLELSDAGVGMDEDTRRRCMEPFFTTKGEYGTGLGLAMVYGTMQRHGSDIEISSAVNEGTTLSFSFPLPALHSTAGAVDEPAAMQPLHILVVDDDPLVSEAVRDLLLVDGHRAVSAEGGLAGVELFLAARARGDAFQVVITDVGMPDMDGAEVCAAVKAADPSTLVLVMTAWTTDGAKTPHVDYVLTKPPLPNELRAALAQVPSAG
jgi:signal transduction histidine kinase